MRAMQAEAPGDALRLAEVPDPTPGPGEALLSVRACGVNFADLLMIDGTYQERPGFPLIPGLEVAGVVLEHGEGVSDPPIGTRVAALCGTGGYAERVCAPAIACVPVPDSMPDSHAAALQVAYGTAELSLRERARLRSGETLLVLGAAGGVGLSAVEIGKRMGAHVVAAARGQNRLAAARSRGADHCVDPEFDDLREAVLTATGGRGADVVFDTVGGGRLREAMRAIAFEGRALPIGFASGDIPSIPANVVLVKNIDVIGVYWGAYYKRRPAALRESFLRILRYYGEGHLVPNIDRTARLERAESVIAALRTRAIVGKAVLAPYGESLS